MLREGLQWELAESCQSGVGGGEIRGVVQIGCRGERVGRVRGGSPHRGRIGLDEQAVQRDGLIQRAQAGVARGEVRAVEGEIRPERGERRDEFDRAAVGMEKETTRRKWDRLQRFEQQPEGVDAVNRGGAVERDGEGELRLKNSALFVQRRAAQAGEARIIGPGAVEHPAVEADLADGCAGIGLEIMAQRFEPRRGTVAGVPRMEAIARREVERRVLRRDARGEGSHGRPVGFLGAIDDDVGDAGGGQRGQDCGDVLGERRGREVVVCVAEVHEGAEAALYLDEVRLSQSADALADGGETIAPRRRKVGEELEAGQGVGVAGGNFGGSGATEKLRETDDKTTHEGRVGIGVESEQPIGPELGGEPYGRDTTEYTVSFDAVGHG